MNIQFQTLKAYTEAHNNQHKEIPVTDVKKIMCKLINMSIKRKFLGFLY